MYIYSMYKSYFGIPQYYRNDPTLSLIGQAPHWRPLHAWFANRLGLQCSIRVLPRPSSSHRKLVRSPSSQAQDSSWYPGIPRSRQMEKSRISKVATDSTDATCAIFSEEAQVVTEQKLDDTAKYCECVEHESQSCWDKRVYGIVCMKETDWRTCKHEIERNIQGLVHGGRIPSPKNAKRIHKRMRLTLTTQNTRTIDLTVRVRFNNNQQQPTNVPFRRNLQWLSGCINALLWICPEHTRWEHWRGWEWLPSL